MKKIMQTKVQHMLNLLFEVNDRVNKIVDDFDIYDSDLDVADEIINNLDELKKRLSMKNDQRAR